MKIIIDMSKSTRMTPAMLEAMGLKEVSPGVYEKATNKYVAGVDPVSEDHVESYFAVMETESDGSKKLMRSINNPDLIQEMRDMTKYYATKEVHEKQKVYCGIDPGKTGAISFMDPKGQLHKWTIPLIGKDVDGSALYKIIEDIKDEYDPVIILEDVHSVYGAGAGSNWQFGYVCGFIRAMVIANKIPFHMVQPKDWQKIMHTNDDKVYKPKKPEQKRPQLDTKATSLKAAMRLFPHCDFRKNERSKVAHDGIVDAVLLAAYGRRLNL